MDKRCSTSKHETHLVGLIVDLGRENDAFAGHVAGPVGVHHHAQRTRLAAKAAERLVVTVSKINIKCSGPVKALEMRCIGYGWRMLSVKEMLYILKR